MTAIRINALFFLGLANMLVGCSSLHVHPVMSAVAFRESCQAGARPLHLRSRSGDYWRGWRAGYVDVSTGGTGQQPAIPPARYWKTGLHPQHRQARADEWYRGFGDGVAAATDDGWLGACVIPGPPCGCTEPSLTLAQPSPFAKSHEREADEQLTADDPIATRRTELSQEGSDLSTPNDRHPVATRRAPELPPTTVQPVGWEKPVGVSNYKSSPHRLAEPPLRIPAATLPSHPETKLPRRNTR